MNRDKELEVLYQYSQTGSLSGGSNASPVEHMLANIILRLERIEFVLSVQKTAHYQFEK